MNRISLQVDRQPKEMTPIKNGGARLYDSQINPLSKPVMEYQNMDVIELAKPTRRNLSPMDSFVIPHTRSLQRVV